MEMKIQMKIKTLPPMKIVKKPMMKGS